MNLFKEFGNFNPRKDKLTDLKSRAYDHYIAFKNMDAEHDCFFDTMRKIENEIERLKDLGFWPSWEKEFTDHSEKFYDSMAIKVFRKADKLKMGCDFGKGDSKSFYGLASHQIEYKLYNN